MINAELLHYWDDDIWEPIDWEEFKKYWPLATDDEKPKSAYSIKGPCRLTYEEANCLAAMGIKLELKPLPGAMLVKYKADGSQPWEYGTRIDGSVLDGGAAVQIAVPDMALMYIDTVEVREDMCTDELQGMLDAGWRILAICPPNSARRPDYILGRRKGKDPFDQ